MKIENLEKLINLVGKIVVRTMAAKVQLEDRIRYDHSFVDTPLLICAVTGSHIYAVGKRDTEPMILDSDWIDENWVEIPEEIACKYNFRYNSDTYNIEVKDNDTN